MSLVPAVATAPAALPSTASVSVVIATFRRPTLLPEAIRSALAQGNCVREVIVIDDAPEGSAEAAVAQIGDPRVRYLRNPQPSGGFAGQVRNVGWQMARGSVIHFLDDDDRVPTGYYEDALDVLQSHPEVGVVFGRIEPFGEDPQLVRSEASSFRAASQNARYCVGLGSRRALAAQIMFRGTVLVCSAALVRRSCVETLQGFDPQLEVMEDVDFYLRVIRSFGARVLDRTALHYRIGPSLMRSPHIDARVLRCYGRIYEKYRGTWGRLDFFAMKLFARTVLDFALRNSGEMSR
jgi:GT2 family glycosyltransferase